MGWVIKNIAVALGMAVLRRVLKAFLRRRSARRRSSGVASV